MVWYLVKHRKNFIVTFTFTFICSHCYVQLLIIAHLICIAVIRERYS